LVKSETGEKKVQLKPFIKMTKIDILFIMLMFIGSFLVLRKGFKEWDKEGYYSINLRLILAGVTMLAVALIMIFQ
jgi:hypothetical protein